MATVTSSLQIPFPTNDDWDTYHQMVEEKIKQTCTDLKATRKGDTVGEIIRFQVADGYAQYIVVQENPLKIMHIHEGDAYEASHILIRGLNLSDVIDMVGREKAIAAMFSR